MLFWMIKLHHGRDKIYSATPINISFSGYKAGKVNG
jgi:hypothetical protein